MQTTEPHTHLSLLTSISVVAVIFSLRIFPTSNTPHIYGLMDIHISFTLLYTYTLPPLFSVHHVGFSDRSPKLYVCTSRVDILIPHTQVYNSIARSSHKLTSAVLVVGDIGSRG